MKRALSLAVALLLVFAVMPRNAVKVNAAALPSEQPEEYVPSEPASRDVLDFFMRTEELSTRAIMPSGLFSSLMGEASRSSTAVEPGPSSESGSTEGESSSVIGVEEDAGEEKAEEENAGEDEKSGEALTSDLISRLSRKYVAEVSITGSRIEVGFKAGVRVGSTSGPVEEERARRPTVCI